MKIKLPITEEFLWDMYNLLEGLGEIGETFGPRSFQETICPGIRSLRYQRQREYNKKNFPKLIYRLKKNGIIKSPDWDPKAAIIVTQKGMEKIFRVGLKMKGKKLRSDGKLEMVIFDIPEKKRKVRDEMRFYLKLFGYKELQKSVWISPFNVLEETQNFIKRYDLENNVKIFLIEKL